MSEFNDPNLSVPPPPPGMAPEQRWSPPPRVERVNMKKGDTFVMNTTVDGVVDNAEFGLPQESTGLRSKLSIVGVAEVNGINERQARVAVVKETRSQDQFDLFWAVSDRQPTEDDPSTQSWVPLALGVKYTIGRTNTQGASDFIDGKKLIGKDFGDDVSRSHLEIGLTRDGVEVKDLSSNGTTVQGVPNRQAMTNKIEAQDTPSGAQAPGFIDRVPMTAEESRAANAEREAQRIEAQNRPIEEHIRQLTAARNRLGEDAGLAQGDYVELDAFSLAKSMKARWQESGNGEMSMASGENMATALSRMSSRARGIAEQWHRYDRQIDDLRDRLK